MIKLLVFVSLVRFCFIIADLDEDPDSKGFKNFLL